MVVQMRWQRPTASANFNQRCELLNAQIAKDDDVDEVVNRSTVA